MNERVVQMWVRIAKITLGFPLKYIIGFVFAMICFVASIAVCGVFVRGMTDGAAVGYVVGSGIFVGIPIGAVLGIFLIDKLILRTAVFKRQMIFGFVMGVVVSVSLAILDLHGVQIFYRLPHDGPSGVLGGFGLFYIAGVLAALLGYTIAGFTKRKTTKEVNPQKE
jgi:hypothetical protein